MRLLQPLRHRSLALLWSGLAFSAIGDQLYAVALTWIAVGVLGPGAGYLSALQSACVLLSVLFAGHWLDRWDHRRVLMADYLVEAGTLLLVVAAWMQHGAASPLLLVCAVIVLSIGIGITRPAVQALLPELLPDRSLLPAANALIDSTDRIARLGGPLIVGVLAGLLPEKHFLTLDALSFLLAFAATLLLPSARRSGAATRAGTLATVLHGFTAVRQDPLLRDCWRIAGLINGTWFVTYFLCVPLAIQRASATGWGGSGLGAFSLVIACYGLTNLVTLLIVGNRAAPVQPAGQIIAAKITMLAGMAIVAVTAIWAPPGLVLPGLMLGALVSAPAGPLSDVPIAVMRQTRVGPGDVAPVVRAFIAQNQVGNIVGLLMAPLLVRVLGIGAVAGLCAALTTCAGLFLIVRYRRYAVAAVRPPMPNRRTMIRPG